MLYLSQPQSAEVTRPLFEAGLTVNRIISLLVLNSLYLVSIGYLVIL